MSKQSLEITEDADDFGFSLVSKEEMEAREQKVADEAAAPHIARAGDAEERLESVMKLVLPFLNNLAKDDNKEYIYWPDRPKKMRDFISKLRQVAGT
jgi:hypothetical protein